MSTTLNRWPAYPANRPSGVSWVGLIPAHWPMQRLKYAAPTIDERLPEKPADSVYVGLEQVESGTGRLMLDTQVEAVESAVSVFRRGDVLFGKLRPYLAKVFHALFDGVCTSELLVFRPAKELDSKFLLYVFLSDGFIGLVNSLTYGVKMPRASSEQIGRMLVPSPSLREQRAIAAFLDRETGRIDTLIAKKRRLGELLQEKRAALINLAVTKGLDSSVPLKASGVDWLGNLPAHWEVRTLGTVARLQRGHDLTANDFIEGDFPVVSSAGVTGSHAFPKAKGPGVITGRYGTIGKIHYIDQDYWPTNTTLCPCQCKTGPLVHRKQTHLGHVDNKVFIENRPI